MKKLYNHRFRYCLLVLVAAGGLLASLLFIVQPGFAGRVSKQGPAFAESAVEQELAKEYEFLVSVPIHAGTCSYTYQGIDLNVGDVFTVTNLYVGVNASHSHRNELRIWLRSPSGTRIQLLDSTDAYVAQNLDVLFTPYGSLDRSGDHDPASPYYDNIWAPHPGSLENFRGEATQGTWQFEICDVDYSETGTLKRLKLIFNALNPAPDLSSSSKTATFSALPGEPVTYTISIANTGDFTATEVTMIDILPDSLLFSHSLSPDLTYDPDTNRISWNGSVGLGKDEDLAFVATIISPECDLVITNTAVISDPSITEPVLVESYTSITCPVKNGWLEGIIYDYDGISPPVTTPVIQVEPAGIEVIPQPGGYYTVSLYPTTYQVSAQSPGYPEAAGPYLVTVPENGTVRQDFILARPDISVSPLELSTAAYVNASSFAQVKISNQGTAPLEFQVCEQPSETTSSKETFSCLETDIPWLDINIHAGVIAAGESSSLELSFICDLAAAGQPQPLSGSIRILHNDPSLNAQDISLTFYCTVPHLELIKTGPQETYNEAVIPITLTIENNVQYQGKAVLTDTLPGGMLFAGGLNADNGYAWEDQGTIHWTNVIDVLKDGGFEAGNPNPFWEVGSKVFGTPICDVESCTDGFGPAPRTGQWWVWFGGTILGEESYISQTLVIPSGEASLDFWLQIPDAYTQAELQVKIDGNTVFSVTELDAEDYFNYSPVSIDLDGYADDRAHVLRIEASTQPEGITSFHVDDMTLNVWQTEALPSQFEISFLVRVSGAPGEHIRNTAFLSWNSDWTSAAHEIEILETWTLKSLFLPLIVVR